MHPGGKEVRVHHDVTGTFGDAFVKSLRDSGFCELHMAVSYYVEVAAIVGPDKVGNFDEHIVGFVNGASVID